MGQMIDEEDCEVEWLHHVVPVHAADDALKHGENRAGQGAEPVVHLLDLGLAPLRI